jgi:UDP-2,4-diacetamido-2,4,6-trideoxy-beta-L-altropyranose hydrolase
MVALTKVKPLIIRADANAPMGTGHLMRCLALGQAWKDAGGQVVCVTACSNQLLLQRLRGEGFVVRRLEGPYPDAQDWEITKRLLAECPEAWLVLDGYHFDSAYQKQVKESGYHLLVIDDMAHIPHYYADIVLNQNLHAQELSYSCEPYTHLLLGTKYVLLRREFLGWRGWRRAIPEVAHKMLVTLGGSDPGNLTVKVIQALQLVELDELEVVVAVGGENPYYEVLESAVRGLGVCVRLQRNVTDMPELMAWADIALSAAGSTCWELAFMGLPSAIVIVGKNQTVIAENIAATGIAVNLGRMNGVKVDEMAVSLTELGRAKEKRASMSSLGRELVNGKGASRVVQELQSFGLRLRAVQAEDCLLIWEWANDPDTRRVSFNLDPIPWETHLSWFKARSSDPMTRFYIALDDEGAPVGQIRFEIKGSECVVSVSVARESRGRGYGPKIIRLGVEKVFHDTGIRTIHAYTRPDNTTSGRAFRVAGFSERGITKFREYTALHYVLQRGESKDDAMD